MAGLLNQVVPSKAYAPTGLLDRQMADFFKRVPDPLEVMRRLGLNVPSSKQIGKFFTAVPEFVGPQADVAGMVRDAGQVMPNIRSGDYGQAFANLGMAAAAIPFMAVPGTVSQVKGVTWPSFGNYAEPLSKGSLERSLPSTKYLVEKIKKKYPDAEIGLNLSRTGFGKSDYLHVQRPNKVGIEIRLSDHSTGLSRMRDYDEMFPGYVPGKGTSFKDLDSPNPPFGQIGRDIFDNRVDRVLSQINDEWVRDPKTGISVRKSVNG